MKRIIVGFVFCLLFVGNCYGFETGKWVAKNGDIQGKLQIKKQGNNYITSLEIFEETRPNFSGGICEFELKSQEVNNELRVFHNNNVSFIFKKEGKTYKMIPKNMSGYEHCGDDIDYDNDIISNLKWKKVK